MPAHFWPHSTDLAPGRWPNEDPACITVSDHGGIRPRRLRGEQNAASENGGGGQVLDGSVSDAMLPYDTVRSQPPYADPIASDSAFDADAAISIGQPNSRASQAAGADAAADSDADPVTPAEE